MAKYPYMTRRKGSKNLCYKRPVPKDLHSRGKRKQIWRSLGTGDETAARAAYRIVDAEIDKLFEQWRWEDSSSAGATQAIPNPVVLSVAQLTPALLRRLADEHYQEIYEADFAWRGELWRKAHGDEEGFWRGDIIAHPVNDWHEVKGRKSSYYAYLMEEPDLEAVFLYCVFFARKQRLTELRNAYKLGDGRAYEGKLAQLLTTRGIELTKGDQARLLRKLMEVEIKALEDLTKGDESTFDGIVERQGSLEVSSQPPTPAKLAHPFSVLMEKYLTEVARESEWPLKTTLRKRSELREFLEIVGDKPVNTYSQDDGVKFKDTESALPANRQRAPFKGLDLTTAAAKATRIREKGEDIDLLSSNTIKDKLNAVSLFFRWAKARDSSVVNPVEGLGVKRPKGRGKKKRHPWTVEELNRMLAAPVYTGWESERRWKHPGTEIDRRSAKFWVPLIALYTGMRLGEIIQLRVADVMCFEGIDYFDVTPVGIDPNDDEAEDFDDADEKSLKTESSRRSIPIHHVLFELGFGDFLKFRRLSNQVRLFPEYEKSKDDGSWSKYFSKYFTRFRGTIGVTRRGVKFHSFRHNVEDALRNADVSQDVRDAVQGHGENGTSRVYGAGFYIRTLNEAVQKLKYDGLALPFFSNAPRTGE